jgi:tRNA (guanine-N7-)-methyltransferase
VRRSPRLPLEQLTPYLLEPPGLPHPHRPPAERHPPPTPLDWQAIFGNDRPIELEVGFGKGLFLLTEATRRREVNFVGIEVVRKYQLYTATRLARRGLDNVRVVCADARPFLRDWVVPGSVSVVHVYFPDPWWKTRHHKRRLFTVEFAQTCERVLRPSGRLSFATDVEEYAHLVAEEVAQTRLHPLPPPEPGTPQHDLDYLTNFERKFRKQGKSIYRALFARPAEPS